LSPRSDHSGRRWKEEAQSQGFLNTVTVSVGRGRDVSDGLGAVFSAIGSDYLRRLSERWEIGVQFDLNFTEGFAEFEGLAVVPIVAYSFTDRLPVLESNATCSTRRPKC
jgi:hypothetical protein